MYCKQSSAYICIYFASRVFEHLIGQINILAIIVFGPINKPRNGMIAKYDFYINYEVVRNQYPVYQQQL